MKKLVGILVLCFVGYAALQGFNEIQSKNGGPSAPATAMRSQPACKASDFEVKIVYGAGF